MTPETEYFLAKAERLLKEADAVMSAAFYEAAGRAAYLASFHAAQAYISEKTGKSVKTHRGVQSELHRLAQDEPDFDLELRAFLGRAYALKSIADYETGPGSDVSPELAASAIATARRFVDYFAALLAPPREGTN